jgi:hypothetical protein
VAAVLGAQEHGTARHLDVGEQLAEHLLRGRALVVDGRRQAGGQAVGELQLRQRPDRGLVREVLDDPRLSDAVVDVHSTVDEDAVAGHLDVVEDDEGVLLVESGGQRAVEGVRAGR